jgi:DNA end-binding protein Ku
MPVRVYAALDAAEHVGFRLLHRKDRAPIVYKKFCSREDVEVPADEIVRGYEVADDEFSVVEKEEIQQVQEELGEGQHTIDVLQFVEPASLDPLLFERPYYVVPDTGGAKAYVLLRDALRDAGHVGIARLYLRRPMLAAIMPRGDVLALEAMRPFDELRAPASLDVPTTKASDAEKRMARKLIDEMADQWDPRAHPNRYRATLEKLLTGRTRFALGEGAAAEAKERPGKVVDLMEALRRSLGSAGDRRRAQPAKRSTTGTSASRARRTSASGAGGKRRAALAAPREA